VNSLLTVSSCKVKNFHFSLFTPMPWTYCLTSASSLRNQNNKLHESVLPQKQDGAHEMCRLPKPSLQNEFSTISKADLNVQKPTFPSNVPSPGRSVTRARRLYVSRLANFRVSDPKYGAANKDVSCRHCAKDGAFGGNPAPPLGAYTVSLLCVVCAERCVTQVP
jgi:hypothetical protein